MELVAVDNPGIKVFINNVNKTFCQRGGMLQVLSLPPHDAMMPHRPNSRCTTTENAKAVEFGWLD